MAGYPFRAINPAQPHTEKNSADVEARKVLRNHLNTGIKSTPVRTSAGSARTKSGQVTGVTKSGGARITGGRG